MINMERNLLFLYGMFVILATFFQTVTSDCSINRATLDKKFPMLLFQNFQSSQRLLDVTYLPTKGNKNLVIGNGKNVLVACPGSKVVLGKTTTNVDTKLCTCKGQNFECDNVQHSPSDVKCTDIPQPVVNRPTTTENFQIGFIVSGKLLIQFDGRYDTTKDITRHTNHQLYNFINDVKIPDSRPSFVEPSFPKCGDLYKQENQKKIISGLFTGAQKKTVEGYFVTGKKYLAKGHLTPNVDYGFPYQRKATFFYHNAVPQWQQINNGHWKALEADVRAMAAKSSNFLNIFTGQVGISEFFKKQLHLCGNQLPVPKFVYKVVILPGAQPKAVAFVMSNNPYDKDESSSFKCTDKCNDVRNFIHIDHTNCANSYEQGCLYCCQVDDALRKSIPFLPVPNLPLLTSI